jgi:hypothetical protein
MVTSDFKMLWDDQGQTVKGAGAIEWTDSALGDLDFLSSDGALKAAS